MSTTHHSIRATHKTKQGLARWDVSLGAPRTMDDINRGLLHILRADARTTYRTMAEEVGLSINAVRDRVRALENQGIVRGYHARFALGVGPGAIAFFQRSRRGSWPHPGFWSNSYVEGAYSGPGRFPLIIHIRPIDHEKAMEHMIDTLVPLGFRLGSIEAVRAPGVQPGLRENPVLEEHDLRLIELLRLDGRATIRKLAEAIHLPETTVRDRIHRLEERGILQGVHAIIDPRALGFTRESWMVASVPDGPVDDLGQRLMGDHRVLNAYCSTTHPGRLLIHTVSAADAPLTELVDQCRMDHGMRIHHFLPVEQVHRRNTDDRIPRIEREKESAAPSAAKAN